MSDDFVRPLLPPPLPLPPCTAISPCLAAESPHTHSTWPCWLCGWKGGEAGADEAQTSLVDGSVMSRGERLEALFFSFLFFLFFFFFLSFFLAFLAFLARLLLCFFFLPFFCLQLKCSVPRSHRRTTTRPRRRPLRSRPTVAENTVYTYSTYFFSMLLEPGSAVVGLPLGRTDGRM